jgi:hypothetical protein
MKEENIKTKINFYYEGDVRPFSSTEDYETLKIFFQVTEDSVFETDVRMIKVGNEMHEIANIEMSILKETQDVHITHGVDIALYGKPMPYNFRVSVYLKRNNVL